MAGFVVCLHTLNLREIMNPILVLLYLGKSPSPPVYFIGSQRVSYLWTNITCGQTIWRPVRKRWKFGCYEQTNSWAWRVKQFCVISEEIVTWTYFILCFCVNCELRHLYKLSGHTIVWRNISSQQTVSIIESNIVFFSERAVPLHLFPFLSTLFFI